MKKYVMGVDGGNSKTDFFLFDVDGNYIDHLRSGSCSHESFKDGYVRAKQELENNIQNLLKRNGLTVSDIESAAFGLAGIDMVSQQKQMESVIREIGFKNFIAVNDSLLGIKAACKSGCGVCSVNGTGTVAGGIDKEGNTLQVGGTGSTFGDEAGGSTIARKAIRGAYDAFYRCGRPTLLCGKLMALLEINDKRLFMETAITAMAQNTVSSLDIMTCLFAAAKEKDEVAIEILEETGKQLAYSAAGCVNHLVFDDTVSIVLIGSVWIKADTPILFNSFKNEMQRMVPKKLAFIKLIAQPAIGAVLWALELYHKQFPNAELIKKVTEFSM